MGLEIAITLVITIPLLAFIIALCAEEKTKWVERVMSEKEINSKKEK